MNKPQIRFKGFEDEWQTSNFKNTFTILKNNTLSRAFLQDEVGSVQNIHYGDILIKYGSCINVPKCAIPSITSGAEPDLNSLSVLQDGDIIFADTAEDEAVGKCSEINNIGNATVVSGLHTIPVRPNFTFAKWFLGYFINSTSYHSTLFSLMQGIKVLSISKSAISNTSLSFPTIQEQQNIGNYFKQIDEMITEAEREVSRLEKMKQASLQKMFPRPGAAAPEVRFDGFSEPWIVRSVGSCFAEGVERGGFDNLLSVGITRGVYPTEDFIKTVTVKDFSNYKTVHNHDIVYNSMRMWQGASGVSYFCGIVSPAYTVLTPRENVWSPFFAYLFKLPWVIKIFEANSQGLTKDTWNLKYPAISIIEFAVPSDIKEQIHIADYFSRLDDLLNAKRQKLAKLRNIKQACLDKMFVNASEL